MLRPVCRTTYASVARVRRSFHRTWISRSVGALACSCDGPRSVEVGVKCAPISYYEELYSIVKPSDYNYVSWVLSDSPCGQWTTYNSEHCVKIADYSTEKRKTDADVVCQSLADGKGEVPRLITVKSKEKQDFLEKFLFKDNNISANVWLGLNFGEDDTFSWNDGSALNFTNWDRVTIIQNEHNEDTETISLDKANYCVEMEQDHGTWIKSNCNSTNIVVCERRQAVTSCQDEFDKYQKASEQRILEIQQKINRIMAEIDQAEKDEISEELPMAKHVNLSAPIGMLYSQLPGSDPPSAIWPGSSWQDVSNTYAGLFFRVLGGASAAFGVIQEQSCPRVSHVNYSYDDVYQTNRGRRIVFAHRNGSYSNYIYTGNDNPGEDVALRFKVAMQEVRPRNQAIKIWKRTS